MAESYFTFSRIIREWKTEFLTKRFAQENREEAERLFAGLVKAVNSADPVALLHKRKEVEAFYHQHWIRTPEAVSADPEQSGLVVNEEHAKGLVDKDIARIKKAFRGIEEEERLPKR